MKQQDPKSIFRPCLFWDAEEIDLAKHAGYIIGRVLDFGNQKDIDKLLEIYPREEIARVVKARRGLLPKTGKYWAVRLNIPVEEVACLKKYYQEKH